jgi:gliding motility-associated-like protein
MKKIIIVLFFIFSSLLSFSSHFMGGELTWICLKGGPNVGQYVFELKVYRDCDGITFSQTALTVTQHNYPNLGATSPILMNFISVSDISPVGYSSGASTSCFDCAGTTGAALGAVEEYIWRSDPIAFAGNPPPEGWHFIWGGGTRSGQITNILNPDSESWTLRAVMYPYDSDPTPAINYLASSPCYDSSPRFKELAKTIICTGYPFAYSHNASDDELDELTYSWAEPLGEWAAYDPNNPNATALPFIAPYTFDLPIPGNPTLDSETGEIAYNSSTAGVFVTCVKVEARKCGQLVAEIYREVQVALLDCNAFSPPVDGLNDPPVVSAPIGPQVWLTTINSAGLPSYETTVFAGDLVQFNIEAEDFDSYAGGIDQNITLNISGGQVSGDYILPNFCANPPCATFNDGSGSNPPVTPGLNGTSLFAPVIVNGFFEWQTSCSHIYADGGVSCNATSNIFNFFIKAYDDFCPANGVGVANIKITVVPPIPDLRCVSVKDNGDIDLTWQYLANTPPTTEPVFVWHATSFLGPYTIIDSVLFPIDIYTHLGANGNTVSQFYFLSNKDGCDTTGADLHSDTLQSIFMDITPINFGVSANLVWNPIHDPLLLTSAIDYEMYVKKSSSPFYNYLTTPLLSYDYEVVKCSEDLQFYVDIPDVSGCISRSSIGTVNLADTLTPKTPIITDISVDSIGKAVISWTTSAGSDHYLIYNVTNQGSVFIDSVHGEFSSTYTYLDSEADSDFETFHVKAIDSCSNSMLATLNHNSIYLSYDLDECAQDLFLTWNEYNSWILGVSFYNLVVKETDLSGVTTIKVDTHLIDVTNYLLTSLVDKYSYKIYVIANDGDTMFSALSNQLSFITDLPKKPDYNYIEYASVNHDNGFVEINCLVDNTAIISHYDVMRSLRYENNFKLLGSVPFDGGTTIHYTDELAETNYHFYKYRIYPVDTCGIRLSAPSFVDLVYVNDTSYAQTILLETEINLDYDVEIPLSVPSDKEGWLGLGWENQYTNTLTFNEYDKWLGDVSEYRLYRSINGESFSLSPICTWERLAYPDIPLQFIDVVTTYGDGNGRFCYYIEAIEGDSTNYGPVSGGALSNVSCVSQTPIIFVPNTFTPNGDEHNEVFRPFTNFVSEEGYSFTIYNRGGSIIFSTNDPLKGWDGRFNGNMIQADNYIFQLQYINGVGEITKKTDIITLVR